MRADAGELLKQEQGAELPKKEKPTTPSAPAEKKKDAPMVQQLETFRGDIEKYMHSGGVSAVTIATAQAERNQKNASLLGEQPAGPTLLERLAQTSRRALFIGVGSVLLLCAVGVMSYVLLRPTTVPVQMPAPAPFIGVDDATQVTIAQNETRQDALAALQTAKMGVALSLGLVGRIEPVVASTTADAPATTMGAQSFLALLAPNIPADLLRTISPTFLLGVHSFDTNQPFLLLKVDPYEQAFAGMLAWEPTMHQDLSPLFDYTPSPHINTDTSDTTTAASSTATAATSSATPATSTTAAVTNPDSAFTQATFVDTIVENHDARALKNTAGDIYFLWTFLDRNTVLITTNPNTVREVITRLKNAPILSIPGQ